MRKKSFVSLLLAMAFLALLVLSGCGAEKSVEEPASNVITMLTAATPSDSFYYGFQKIIDNFNANNEYGVTVQCDFVSTPDFKTKLPTLMSSDSEPDIIYTLELGYLGVYVDAGKIVNLQPYYDADPAWRDSFNDGMLDQLTYNGDVYGVPTQQTMALMFYNKAIFDQYGVDYPTADWTWEDMYEAAKKITEGSNGDVYGLAMNTSNNQDGWYNLVYDYGGTIVGEDHKTSTIGSAEGKAGMEMVRKLLSVGAPQSVVAETGTDSLFQSGKCAMITQGSWMINSFYKAENHADYYWALLPYADVNGNGQCDDGERQSCYNGLGWAASAGTANPDACYSLISYLCSEEAQKKQAELGVTMAGMEGMSEAFGNAFEGMDVSPFIEMEDFKLYFRPYSRNTTVWEDKIQQAGAFLDAWQNPDDPAVMEKACDNAQQIIDDAIAQE